MGKDQKRVEINDPETGEVVGIMTGMAVSNVRDYLLSRRRAAVMATTWDKLSEDDQKKEIEMASEVAEELVAKIVDLVAAGGHDVIHAKLDNFKIKDGAITVTAKGAADDGALLALNHIGHKNLKIVVADAEKYDEQRDNVEAEPDQADFLTGDAPADPQMDDEDDLHADDEGDADAPATEDDGQVEAKLDETEAVPDPEQDGYNARMDGAGPDDNPFDGGTDFHTAWANGFARGQTDADLVIKEGYDCAYGGGSIDDCAWKKDSSAHGFWMQGFNKGAADLAAIEDVPDEPEGDADPETVATEGVDDDLKDDSFGQGKRTAERGEGKDQNPYSEGSTKFNFWNDGFDSVEPVDE